MKTHRIRLQALSTLVALLAAASWWFLHPTSTGSSSAAGSLANPVLQAHAEPAGLARVGPVITRSTVSAPEPVVAPDLAESTLVEKATGGLRVRVIQADGRGVSARVSLHEAGADPRGEDGIPQLRDALGVRFTDASGSTVFGDLAPGRYQLLVDEFADHLVPLPASRDRSVREGEASFLEDLTLDGHPGERTFVLSAGAWIGGLVSDDRGRGIEGARVCAALQDPLAHRSVYTTTDAEGRYRIRCAPGRQHINVYLERDHAWSDAARPLPQTVDLLAGDLHAADFVLSRSGAAITGVVLDQDGQPMPDLEVLCYYKPDQAHLPEEERSAFTLRDHARSVRTGSDGRFELVGLPAERFGIQVGPEDYQPVGRGRLGRLVPRRIADLRYVEHVDLGVISVHRSRPFWLHGQVLLAQRSTAAAAKDAGDLRLYAVLQPGDRRAGAREVRIPIRQRGSELVFEWACETPEEAVRLELRGPAGALAQQEITPVPDGVAQARIVVPGGS